MENLTITGEIVKKSKEAKRFGSGKPRIYIEVEDFNDKLHKIHTSPEQQVAFDYDDLTDIGKYVRIEYVTYKKGEKWKDSKGAEVPYKGDGTHITNVTKLSNRALKKQTLKDAHSTLEDIETDNLMNNMAVVLANMK